MVTQTQPTRSITARRISPSDHADVRVDSERPTSLPFVGPETLAGEQRLALRLLQKDPAKWIRPLTDARLLAYLVLALEGLVVTVEDEQGLKFRLSAFGRTPRHLAG